MFDHPGPALAGPRSNAPEEALVWPWWSCRPGGTRWGSAVAAGGPGATLLLHGATIEGASGDAIAVDERAYARLSGVAGSGNAGAGVHLGEGVRVTADAATAVTGSKNILLRGDVA
ncbi:MAG: hypothetical protein ACR2KK_21690 [Acidimicrobiales bacterium]